MKTKLLGVTVAAGLALVGCQKKDQSADACAAALEAAKAEVAKLDALNGRLKEALHKERDQSALLASQLEVSEARVRDIASKANAVVESSKALSQARATLTEVKAERERARAAAPEQLTDEQKLAAYEAGGIAGVETQASRDIIKKAKLESSAWRAVFEIESEGKGWLAVHAFATTATTMPLSVRDGIVMVAKRKYPGEWSRMADEISEEAQAWTTLDEWSRTNVPGLNRADSARVLASAKGRYPDDWSMALFIVDDEVKNLSK
jgi:hypothetical protein